MYKADNRDRRQEKVAYPYYFADFQRGGQDESNQNLPSKPISVIAEHNPLLGRLRITRELIKRMDYILERGELGEQGFLLMLLYPIKDNIREIEDFVNSYPLKLDFAEEIRREETRDNHCDLSRNRHWFIYKVRIHETDWKVYVLCSMLRKHLYKSG